MKGMLITVKDWIGNTVGKRHTWTDWGLILAQKPDVVFPEVKTNYIDLTGVNGHVDLTETLTDDVKYKNRTGSFVFTKIGDRENWNNFKSDIANFLHGRYVEIIIDEDPSFYYTGRLSLDWKSDKKTGQITLNYNLDPYKYELTTSLEDWKWDTFNFELGVIREWINLPVVPNEYFEVVGSRKASAPKITVVSSDGRGLTFNGSYGHRNSMRTFTLPDGTYIDPMFIIHEGNNYWTSQSTGTITIEYRGASL